MTPSGYWAWEPEEKKISVQIQLDLVERMSSAMLDGFGAVPRRGAEVGGILLGAYQDGDPRVVRIDDFVPVPCTHKFGPSFVLTDDEMTGVEGTLAQLKEREANGAFVVGYYRSHTRDGLSLAGEDLQYCERFFQDPRQVVLLVRPSVMHVSRAAFFLYEDGLLQPVTPLEFSFRRSELETGHAPARRTLEATRAERLERIERRQYPAFQPDPKMAAQAAAPGDSHTTAYAFNEPAAHRAGGGPMPSPDQGALVPVPQSMFGMGSGVPPLPEAGKESRIKRGWIWYPLSFIFLLLGVLLGFQGALSVNQDRQSPQVIQDPYSLNLSVVQTGDDLALRWDRSNVAVRTAQRGLLDIADGKFTKRVELDSQQLRTGSVIYQYSSTDVKFRLEVYPNDRAVLSETISWKTPN